MYDQPGAGSVFGFLLFLAAAALEVRLKGVGGGMQSGHRHAIWQVGT